MQFSLASCMIKYMIHMCRMSADKNPTEPCQQQGQTETRYSKLWNTVTSLIVGDQGHVKTREQSSLDMQDNTYLIDMDGEGLCLNHMISSNKAFKKL